MDDGSLSQVGSHQSDSSPLKMIFLLFRIIITPLSYVTFADFWVAGMYLSLSLVPIKSVFLFRSTQFNQSFLSPKSVFLFRSTQFHSTNLSWPLLLVLLLHKVSFALLCLLCCTGKSFGGNYDNDGSYVYLHFLFQWQFLILSDMNKQNLLLEFQF